MNHLNEKYQIKPAEYYSGVRTDVLPLLPKHSKRILEIGCGSGSTLAYLKDNNYCSWTCGVDIFPEAIEIASHKADKVFQANIEEMNLLIEPRSIDVILCLDVLEHLVNPEKIVAYLHTLLTPTGNIIASIPNVRHRSVVIPLLFQDRWDYLDRGVLDNTHLRFFVRNTAIQLMQSSGLQLEKISSNYGGKKDKFLDTITFGLISSLFKVQYLISVKNS
jgi:2-polyprenyl-3-methyl-5-hydroxy-6-metoxy-1,4-benzoquinol methylase